jgi:hypothetical protein
MIELRNRVNTPAAALYGNSAFASTRLTPAVTLKTLGRYNVKLRIRVSNERFYLAASALYP